MFFLVFLVFLCVFIRMSQFPQKKTVPIEEQNVFKLKSVVLVLVVCSFEACFGHVKYSRINFGFYFLLHIVYIFGVTILSPEYSIILFILCKLLEVPLKVGLQKRSKTANIIF